jgi:hypothetical protein
MTQDEVLKASKETGMDLFSMGVDRYKFIERLTNFTKLVEDSAFKRWAAQTKLAVEDEREACAKIAFNAKTYIEAAKAIRARGQQ